jgi:hypothetical protein
LLNFNSPPVTATGMPSAARFAAKNPVRVPQSVWAQHERIRSTFTPDDLPDPLQYCNLLVRVWADSTRANSGHSETPSPSERSAQIPIHVPAIANEEQALTEWPKPYSRMEALMAILAHGGLSDDDRAHPKADSLLAKLSEPTAVPILLIRRCETASDNSRGITDSHGVRRNVSRNDSPCPHHGPLSDADTAQNDRWCADPNILPYVDLITQAGLPVCDPRGLQHWYADLIDGMVFPANDLDVHADKGETSYGSVHLNDTSRSYRHVATQDQRMRCTDNCTPANPEIFSILNIATHR